LKELFTNEEPLAQYLNDIRTQSYLTIEEEITLARRWRDRRDPAAMERLIGSHLRLVIKMAKGMRGYGLPLADLVSEGNIGLMQAVGKFDPDRGFRFATYAAWWIRAAMQSYVLHNWSLVRLGTTGAQKKLFFNLRRLKGRMQELENGELSPGTVSAIATELGVSEDEVVSMNRRLGYDASLNAPAGAEDSGTQAQDLLADDRPGQERELADREERERRMQFLKLGLGKLNDRERRILVARRLAEEPETLEVLGQEFAISKERVRQIEVAAFEKIRKAVLNHDRADDPAMPGMSRAARTVAQQHV
jgi:RNA polymerase sigma-32 factor